MNYLPPEPVYQAPPEYLVGKTTAEAFDYLSVCPYAQTLTAYSLTHYTKILFVLPCRRWSCRVCSAAKIQRLAGTVRLAKPNRLLTLTVDPSLYVTPAEAWGKTRRKVPILIRGLRKRFGEVEYLRVTEVTKKGWPHFHLLVRSAFLPQPVVKSEWRSLTGAKIVDLRKVNRSFSAYTYLVKYLSKLHKLEWTERHVSLSRGFAPPVEDKGKNTIEYQEPDFHNFHPSNYLAERHVGDTVVRLSPHAHLIYSRDFPDDRSHSTP